MQLLTIQFLYLPHYFLPLMSYILLTTLFSSTQATLWGTKHHTHRKQGEKWKHTIFWSSTSYAANRKEDSDLNNGEHTWIQLAFSSQFLCECNFDLLLSLQISEPVKFLISNVHIIDFFLNSGHNGWTWANARSEVLMLVAMTVSVFCDVMPYCLVKCFQYLGKSLLPHLHLPPWKWNKKDPLNHRKIFTTTWCYTFNIQLVLP